MSSERLSAASSGPPFAGSYDMLSNKREAVHTAKSAEKGNTFIAKAAGIEERNPRRPLFGFTGYALEIAAENQ